MTKRFDHGIFLCDLCRSFFVAVKLAALAAGPVFDISVLRAGCFLFLDLFQIMYMRWLIIDIYIESKTNYFTQLRGR